MANQRVGILIVAKDQASKAIRGIGVSAKTSLTAVRGLGQGGAAAMKALGVGAALLNQTIELGKKAWEVFRLAIGDTIAKALEFRGEGDSSRKFFQGLSRDADLLRARIGDALIPVAQGFGTVLRGLINSIRTWISDNRQLIGTKLVEWISAAAQAITGGLLSAIGLLSKAWNGWKLIIETVQLVINRFFEGVLIGGARVMTWLASVSDRFGQGGLAGKLREAAAFARGLGDEFGRSGDVANVAIANTAGQIDQINQSLARAKQMANDAIRQGATEAMRLLDQNTQGANISLERQAQILERISAVAKRQFGEIAAQEARKAELYAKTAQFQDQQMQRSAQAAQTAAVSITNSFGAAMQGLVSGQQTASQAVVGAIFGAARAAINAYAAQAAAGAAASQAAVPIVGPALAAAAASAMLGVVQAMAQKFADGGLVTGGTPGRDSVLGLLTPGERVLTVEQNRAFESGMMGGNTTVNVKLDSTVPDRDTNTRRAMRVVGRELRELQRRGALRGLNPSFSGVG